MIRASAVLGIMLIVAGCAEQDALPDNPFAPGVAKRGTSVDGAIVGHRLINAGEFDLAIDAFSRAAAETGEMTPEILIGLGSANLGLGRLGQAETLLRRAVAADETSPEAWNNLGVVLMEKGETSEASEVFRRAYALDNGQSDSIRDNLRLALAKLDDSFYGQTEVQEFKMVRRGSSDYLIRSIP